MDTPGQAGEPRPRARPAAGRESSQLTSPPCRAPARKTPFLRFPRGNCSTRKETKSCTSYLLWVGTSPNAGRSLPSETRWHLGAKVSSSAPTQLKAGKAAALRWTCPYLWWGPQRALALLHHAPAYQLCLTGPLIPHISSSHSKKSHHKNLLVPCHAPSSFC